MTDKKTLLPCPFCGKAGLARLCSSHEDMEDYANAEYWSVMCDASKEAGQGPGGCGGQGGFHPTQEKAIEAWNRRPAPVAEPVFSLVCDKCKVDRLTNVCPSPQDCGMTATPHVSGAAIDVPSDAKEEK